MTIVSSIEFRNHQDKYLELALNERVFIRRGNNMLSITNANDENEYDYEDLMDAKAYTNDEDTNLADFKKYINELAK
jgi:hypothetical protein